MAWRKYATGKPEKMVDVHLHGGSFYLRYLKAGVITGVIVGVIFGWLVLSRFH